MISRLNPEMMPYIRHTAAIPKNIPIYVKRKESTSSRSFRVRVEGIGLDGQTKSTLLTISQAGYQLRASSELSTLDVLPQEGGTYNLNIKLTPTDVPIPAGNLYVQVVYSGEQISVSDKVETASNTYSYPVSITIPANKNPESYRHYGLYRFRERDRSRYCH